MRFNGTSPLVGGVIAQGAAIAPGGAVIVVSSEPLPLRAGHADQSVTDCHLRESRLGDRAGLREPQNGGRQ